MTIYNIFDYAEAEKEFATVLNRFLVPVLSFIRVCGFWCSSKKSTSRHVEHMERKAKTYTNNKTIPTNTEIALAGDMLAEMTEEEIQDEEILDNEEE